MDAIRLISVLAFLLCSLTFNIYSFAALVSVLGECLLKYTLYILTDCEQKSCAYALTYVCGIVDYTVRNLRSLYDVKLLQFCVLDQ